MELKIKIFRVLNLSSPPLRLEHRIAFNHSIIMFKVVRAHVVRPGMLVVDSMVTAGLWTVLTRLDEEGKILKRAFG